jgi:1A family penicillin-binding protein
MRQRYGNKGIQQIWKKINWGKLALFGSIGTILTIILGIVVFSANLPDPTNVQRVSGFSTQIMDRTGKVVLYDVYSGADRKFTPLEDIPEDLKNATLAIEDKDFYKHKGFDPLAIPRIAKNLLLNQRLIGGSTLTQQLVKNVLLTNERTVTRKIKEFLLAQKIERNFSKDEILEMYLNEAPYGGATVGIGAATNMYFGKDPVDLTLPEMIILAGLPQAPSRYSPYRQNNTSYLTRAQEVLRRMVEDGHIGSDKIDLLTEELAKVEFAENKQKLKAPHFVMHVRDQLEEMYGEDLVDVGGFRVITSLDWEIQQVAERVVREEIDKVSKSLNISNGASVVIDSVTGEVLSMVGSKNYFDATIDGQVNVATRLRQPGSAIKPLVYATAFDKGFSPSSILMDVVTEFPGKDANTPYIPKNYDGKERGPVSLRQALGSSLNIPAVKLLALTGVKDVLNHGYRLGLDNYEPTREMMSRVGLSMALGGAEVRLLDLVSAYGAYSNGGYKVRPVTILKIDDSRGQTIFETKQVSQERVVNPEVSYLVSNVLSDNVARTMTFSANSILNTPGRSVAVKTGTTNDLRDNWAVGWTNETVVGVWVGNNDNAKMRNVASGISGASPIWRRQMNEVLRVRPDKPFDRPLSIVDVSVDKISGWPVSEGSEGVMDVFWNKYLPSGPDPIHSFVKVCKNDASRLADPVTVSQGNYDEKRFIVLSEKDPLTNRDLWQVGINRWIASQADPKYKMPTEYCNAESGIDVQLYSPKDKSRVDGEVTISFDVASASELTKVEVWVNDYLEKSFSGPPYNMKLKLNKGRHKVRVVATNKDGRTADKIAEFAVDEDYTEKEPDVIVLPVDATVSGGL